MVRNLLVWVLRAALKRLESRRPTCHCGHAIRDHYKPSPFRDGTCQWMGCKCFRADPPPPAGYWSVL